MKLMLKLAVEAVEERDLISDESRRLYGEGFMAGFCKAREMAAEIANRKESDSDYQILRLGEEEA